MKKFLLTCALAVAAFAPAMAAESTYGFCEDELNGLGVSTAKYYYGVSIMMPSQLQVAYPGGIIKSLSVGYGQNSNKEATIFLSHDLYGEPFYTQKVNLKDLTFTEVTLDTPFTLDGQDLYIGYTTYAPNANDFPLGIDFNTETIEYADLLSFADSEAKLKQAWSHVPGYGNVAIRAKITTEDNVEGVFPLSVTHPTYTAAGKPFDAQLSVINLGSSTVSSVKVDTKAGNSEVISNDYPVSIEPCGISNVNITGLTIAELGSEQKLIFDVTGIDGKVNGIPNAVVESTIAILEDGSFYVPTVVIEEFTGTSCPWCPRGYVGMETMNEKYKDGSYIGIAVHNYDKADPMYSATYASPASQIMRNVGLNGFPGASVNRITGIDPSPESCVQVYDLVREQIYTEQKIELTALYSNLGYDSLDVFCNVTSLVDTDTHNLGIAIVTTENEVGPYAQANNYAGGRYGEMGGFESMGTYAKVMFNDVARNIVNWNGSKKTLPATIEANVPAESEQMVISLSDINNLSNAFVSALLIDTKTGMIINGARIPLPEKALENVNPAIVEGIAADVDGIEYFTLDGVRVRTDILAPGLYIKREAGKASKILVK